MAGTHSIETDPSTIAQELGVLLDLLSETVERPEIDAKRAAALVSIAQRVASDLRRSINL